MGSKLMKRSSGDSVNTKEEEKKVRRKDGKLCGWAT